MAFNNFKSFLCKVIIKQGEIVQPIMEVLDFWILMEKLDSASQNPVIHQGFKVDNIVFLFNWL
jgi:aminoglycoside phosphotransferase (APT) family kinase protein